MKVGIFSPYLDTLGGGERYMMAIAECLSQNGHEVDIFWDPPGILKKLKERFNFNLKNVRLVNNIFFKKDIYRKWLITKNYDLFFFLSDGSIPFLFAKKNFLIFTVPFTNKNGRSLLNEIKLKNFFVIAISKFTKKFIDKEYGVKSKVIYPPVNVDDLSSGKKQNLILSVSRFSETLHAKKQAVLIEVFSNLFREGLKDWQLILAGGLIKQDESYLNRLKKQAENLPIKFLTNVSHKKLREVYNQTKIFWHATGFGEDEKTHPEKMEHFGIVVVEAMAAGCVPIVIGKGGIPEIITHGVDGFLWQTKKELGKLTLQTISQPEMMKKISIQSIKDSQKFSEKVFCKKISKLVTAQ